MELVKDGDPHQPDAELTKALVKHAAGKGLVLLSCGLYGNVIRLLPPLTASTAVVDEGLSIIVDSLRQLAGADAKQPVGA
jgi:4-aminobutyrate aminotransferase/(S)-3-amino-2-methylpropionate transaminase